MKTVLKFKTLWMFLTLAFVLLSPAQAGLIVNGGFESGFTGWTRADQVGSDGTFFLQTGTLSPVNAMPVPAPPQGSRAAMTDAQGPGTHVLFQSFMATAPAVMFVLTFDVFVGNRADRFATPNTLDFSTPALNQQARVDILAGGADPFSVAAADVLLNAFKTNPGDALVSGYTHYAVNVTAALNSHLNTPLLLRFAETDNLNIFQFGVDNVDINAQVVPEPSLWLPTLGALLGVSWFRVRRRRRVS